jgi:hypothetical protein
MLNAALQGDRTRLPKRTLGSWACGQAGPYPDELDDGITPDPARSAAA